MAVSTSDMTVADLLERFGPIPAARIRTDPPPGTATEQDVIDIENRSPVSASWWTACWWRKLWVVGSEEAPHGAGLRPPLSRVESWRGGHRDGE